jgi:hypothetical protein
LIGSVTWGLWVAVLGVLVLRRPVGTAGAALGQDASTGSTSVLSPRPPAAAGVRS